MDTSKMECKTIKAALQQSADVQHLVPADCKIIKAALQQSADVQHLVPAACKIIKAALQQSADVQHLVPADCKIVKATMQQSGDTIHLVPDFYRKLSLSDAECAEQEQALVVSAVRDLAHSPTTAKATSASEANVAAQDFETQDSTNTSVTSKNTSCSSMNISGTSMNASEAAQFLCSCGEKFDKSVQLASHKRWSCQFKKKTAQCDLCDGWFATDVGLKRHMKHAHGGIISCSSCNLRFPTKLKLTRHWIEAHYDETKEELKLLKCFVCDDTNFDNKFELECHLVVHKYEKHQQKMADHGLYNPTPSTHFTPYSHFPFERVPFNQLHRSPFQFFPLHRPHMPFFPPPPPPFYPPSFSPGSFPFPPPMFNATEPVSTSKINNSTSPKATETSTAPQEDLCMDKQTGSENIPRHDHVYVETMSSPKYHHHHHKKHGKLNWKKYLKLMIKGKVPFIWQDRWMPYGKDEVVEATNQNVASDKVDEHQPEFKIACKFCDSVIERNRINWHQRRECPVLAVHKCAVCDRVFRKRHFLIRHMHEQNHYSANSELSSTVTTSSVVNSSNLSATQEKLSSSLQLLNVSEAIPMDVPKDVQSNMPTSIEVEEPSASQITGDKGSSIERIELDDRFQSQCCVCRLMFFKKELLYDHLRGHISQISTIQKVNEWTMKSSDYFLLGDSDDDQNTATSSSCLDTEITSTTGSLVPENSSDTSELKWTKPHTKRSGHHAKGEVLLCEFCNEQFSFRKDLHYHMETQHKDSTLKCPLCKKKFSWKKRGKFYERHLNSHFGVKVFKHKCDVCGKTFLENSKLRAHMSLHNNDLLHRCTVCQKGYANKSSLVRHERMHTGIRPYQCEVCSEGFMEKRELLRHSTAHTGVAPFTCGECGQGFTLKTSLMSHMKKKHNK